MVKSHENEPQWPFQTSRKPKKIQRPIKAIKAKSKARLTKVSHFYNFFTFLGSLGPNRVENDFRSNSETRKATKRPLDSMIGNLQAGMSIDLKVPFQH